MTNESSAVTRPWIIALAWLGLEFLKDVWGWVGQESLELIDGECQPSVVGLEVDVPTAAQVGTERWVPGHLATLVLFSTMCDGG